MDMMELMQEDRIKVDDFDVRVTQAKYGTFCYWPHDKWIGRAMEIYGEYSEGEVELFRQLLQPGHVVIEVGSNIGTLTVPIARMVGDGGRVFAFEPQRLVFQQLCANLALNGLLNVWALHQGVGAATGQMGVPFVDYTKEGNFGGVELVPQSPEMVQVIKLDEARLGHVHFLKIDCEGMELAVIQGASGVIEQCKPAIYCENDREQNSRDLIKALLDRGYDMWWHLPPLFNPNNFRSNPENIYGPMVSCNMLCIPAEFNVKVNGMRKIVDPDDRWDMVLQ